MAGPSLQWLSTGFPSLQELAGMPAPAPGGPATIALGAPPQAPPPMLALPGAPPPPPAPAPGPMSPPAPTPPGPNMSLPHEDPNRMMSVAPPAVSQGPAPVPTGVEPAPPAPPPLPDVQFRGVGGGVVPAHEAPNRGPLQNELLMGSFDAPMQAADRIDFRSQLQAQREQDEYERQAEAAMQRQTAMERVAQRRAAEMEQRRVEYDEHIARQGQMHLDDNRWWAKKSTGDKIGTLGLIFLGSIASLGNGGQNLAYNATLKEIDDDLAAQKFDYMNSVEQGRAAQNAYAMAMDQYQQEDAAYNAARAGALEFAAAKVGALSAQWKGTESANAADQLRAQLLMERDRTAAAGLTFVPAKGVAGGYKMLIRGQEVPGLVTEKQAQEYALKYGVDPNVRKDEKLFEGGVNLAVETGKADAQQQAKKTEHPVQMPNGETVFAPSAPEADKLRELSTNASHIQRLVREAKEIRDNPTFRVSIEGRNKLGQIQKDLITAFAVKNKLGAISGPDMDLALGGTADLFQFGNGVEARLDRLNQQSIKSVTDRVGTYPGAPPKSSGKMPGSTQYHGGSK